MIIIKIDDDHQVFKLWRELKTPVKGGELITFPVYIYVRTHRDALNETRFHPSLTHDFVYAQPVSSFA